MAFPMKQLYTQWGARVSLSRNEARPPSWLIAFGKRRLFATSRDGDVHMLEVACGSSGLISIDLHNASALSQPTSPLIIYLPPTGTHLRPQHPPIPSFLRTPFAALAQINYRWNIPLSTDSNPSHPSSLKLLSSHPSYANHPFPTPLHDTLHAYTYLLKQYLPRFSPSQPKSNSSSQPRRTLYGLSPTSLPKQIQRPLLIYGSFLGGTLATSLALTESFASKQLPATISGFIARDAVFDWTAISTSETPLSELETERSTWKGWDSTTLHALKKRLFANPASTFDSFASPLLFFRTASLAVPTSPWDLPTPPSTVSTTISSIPLSAPDEKEEWPPHIINEYKLLMEEGIPGKRVSEFKEPVTRRANLKFPPRESGLVLPRSLFLTTTSKPSPPNTPLSKKTKKSNDEVDDGLNPRAQANEMGKLMKRSVLLHEFKERKLWDEDLDPYSASEDRVQILGLPPSNQDLENQEERFVREWIEDCLG